MVLKLGDVNKLMNVTADDFVHWARARYAGTDSMYYVEELARGRCLHAGCYEPGEVRPQPTQYGDELSNWTCLCERHKAENDAYWAERIAELAGDRL